MSFSVHIQRGLKAMERGCNQYGKPKQLLIWAGVEYPCVISTLHRGAELIIGGLNQTVELSLLVRKDVMSEVVITADVDIYTADSTTFTADNSYTPPMSGSKVVVGHFQRKRQYRVLKVAEPAPGSHWEFMLGVVDQ